ncbi:hypothetical protein GGR52DRAFT_547513 [Hypoxylon sp. FL1284]|nr:hypothetical protein GGR52DRAFT_547513 [Hypoxylon sp. FL1284]
MSSRAWLNGASSGATTQSNTDKVIDGRVTKRASVAKGNATKEKEKKLQALDIDARSESSDDDGPIGDPLVPTPRDLSRVWRRYQASLQVEEDEANDHDEDEIMGEDPTSPSDDDRVGFGFSAQATSGGFSKDGRNDAEAAIQEAIRSAEEAAQQASNYIAPQVADDVDEQTEDEEFADSADEELAQAADEEVSQGAGEEILEHSDDEEGSVLDEFRVPNAPELLEHFKRVARGTIEGREPSSDDATPPSTPSASPSPADSPTSYDPEEAWRYEQIYLNQILRARDEYTLMPTTWRMHFRGVPLPDGLFYVQTQERSFRPRIYAHSERFEYQGAKILRRLMQLHGRIREFRRLQATNPDPVSYGYTIGGRIRKELTSALHWAERDADLAQHAAPCPPNTQILEMLDADRMEMDLHIQQGMSDRAEEWRELLNSLPEEGRPEAPVLFCFVIYKHIIFIVTLDAANPDAVCHIPIQLNISEENQSQWNALAIMVTVCWARDLMSEMVKKLQELPAVSAGEGVWQSMAQQEESDPDA